jgi:hypothetical protein
MRKNKVRLWEPETLQFKHNQWVVVNGDRVYTHYTKHGDLARILCRDKICIDGKFKVAVLLRNEMRYEEEKTYNDNLKLLGDDNRPCDRDLILIDSDTFQKDEYGPICAMTSNAVTLNNEVKKYIPNTGELFHVKAIGMLHMRCGVTNKLIETEDNSFKGHVFRVMYSDPHTLTAIGLHGNVFKNKKVVLNPRAYTFFKVTEDALSTLKELK